MKYLGKITDDKDLVTKEFVDDSIAAIDADETYQGEITASTDLSTLTNGVWGVGDANGGIYHTDFPTTNDAYYGYLIQYNTTYKNQLLVAGKPGVSQLFHRRWLTNSSAFTAWLKVTDSSDLSSYMKKGVDYVTAGKKSGTNVGQYSTAEGYNTTASGNYSHAEGYNTVVLSVASHAEGGGTTAMWDGAHAEGGSTVSKGEASHAEGMNTIAKHRAQHVFGEANIEDPASGLGNTKGTYIEIVGNGSDNSGTITRSNARTLDWSGNEKLAGSITVGNSATMQYNSTDKSIDFVFI